MTTLDDRPVTVIAKTPDWLSPEQVRHSALSCIVNGTTFQHTAATRRRFAMIADQMDALLAEGIDPAAFAESVLSAEED